MKKIINKLKNTKPRTKKIIIILLVIFMLLSIAFKWYFGSLHEDRPISDNLICVFEEVHRFG